MSANAGHVACLGPLILQAPPVRILIIHGMKLTIYLRCILKLLLGKSEMFDRPCQEQGFNWNQVNTCEHLKYTAYWRNWSFIAVNSRRFGVLHSPRAPSIHRCGSLFCGIEDACKISERQVEAKPMPLLIWNVYVDSILSSRLDILLAATVMMNMLLVLL